ncbi:MAG: 50S ribosomal protein L11 methyltransferase [Thermoanaerobaculia bacterium]|nr:50S ribosomal protein L11 methyltransferase [Thermoanaerobaculia bacterium]
MATYRQITYCVPVAREDEFASWLAIRGSVGCSVVPDASDPDAVRLTAYFQDDGPNLSADDLAAWRAVEASSTRLKDADWLATYRAASMPFDVGASFRIDPREPQGGTVREAANEGTSDQGRTLLHIPARTAFGTGSHESTRLCIRWLEELAERADFRTRLILDVGTGSGILALCAEKLGARPVLSYDLDAASVLVARDNALSNGCGPLIWAGTLASLSQRARFDLVLVNVLPERILEDYPDLVARLHDRAQVVSSGNLVARRDELLARFGELGLELVGEKTDGEWMAFLLRKVGP